jgi:hypothetical protein
LGLDRTVDLFLHAALQRRDVERHVAQNLFDSSCMPKGWKSLPAGRLPTKLGPNRGSSSN